MSTSAHFAEYERLTTLRASPPIVSTEPGSHFASPTYRETKTVVHDVKLCIVDEESTPAELSSSHSLARVHANENISGNICRRRHPQSSQKKHKKRKTASASVSLGMLPSTSDQEETDFAAACARSVQEELGVADLGITPDSPWVNERLSVFRGTFNMTFEDLLDGDISDLFGPPTSPLFTLEPPPDYFDFTAEELEAPFGRISFSDPIVLDGYEHDIPATSALPWQTVPKRRYVRESKTSRVRRENRRLAEIRAINAKYRAEEEDEANYNAHYDEYNSWWEPGAVEKRKHPKDVERRLRASVSTPRRRKRPPLHKFDSTKGYPGEGPPEEKRESKRKPFIVCSYLRAATCDRKEERHYHRRNNGESGAARRLRQKKAKAEEAAAQAIAALTGKQIKRKTFEPVYESTACSVMDCAINGHAHASVYQPIDDPELEKHIVDLGWRTPTVSEAIWNDSWHYDAGAYEESEDEECSPDTASEPEEVEQTPTENKRTKTMPTTLPATAETGNDEVVEEKVCFQEDAKAEETVENIADVFRTFEFAAMPEQKEKPRVQVHVFEESQKAAIQAHYHWLVDPRNHAEAGRRALLEPINAQIREEGEVRRLARSEVLPFRHRLMQQIRNERLGTSLGVITGAGPPPSRAMQAVSGAIAVGYTSTKKLSKTVEAEMRKIQKHYDELGPKPVFLSPIEKMRTEARATATATPRTPACGQLDGVETKDHPDDDKETAARKKKVRGHLETMKSLVSLFYKPESLDVAVLYFTSSPAEESWLRRLAMGISKVVSTKQVAHYIANDRKDMTLDEVEANSSASSGVDNLFFGLELAGNTTREAASQTFFDIFRTSKLGVYYPVLAHKLMCSDRTRSRPALDSEGYLSSQIYSGISSTYDNLKPILSDVTYLQAVADLDLGSVPHLHMERLLNTLIHVHNQSVALGCTSIGKLTAPGRTPVWSFLQGSRRTVSRPSDSAGRR